MKTLSLKSKYTIFISLFFALAIAISTMLTIQETVSATIKIFVADGTPLVKRGSEFLSENTALFKKIAQEKNPESDEYEKLRLHLLSLKETSSAKYFYSMISANANEYMYVIDGSCDPSDEENFSALGDFETKDNYGKPAELALLTGEVHSSKMVEQEGWGHLITIFCPIFDGEKTIGFLAADYDATSLRSSIKKMILQTIFVATVLIVIVCVLVSVILKKLFFRIQKINKSIGDIASGKADLSQRITIYGNDEIGALGKSCNALIENLADMISSIKNSVETLSDTGKEVNAQTQMTIQNVEKARDAMSNIDLKAKKQSETMDALFENSGKVESTINLLDEKIETQTQAISQVSSSAEEISANIKSADSNIFQISERYEHLVQVSKSGQEDQKIVAQKVLQIQDQAKQLQNANTVVAKLANETNLLAMNAAIEAAHAGSFGAGFAVVASEIRNLAENSAKQSKSIALVIKSITDSIFGIVDASKLSLASFQNVDEKIIEIQQMLEQVRFSIDEQQTGANNLLDSMMLINNSSHAIENASREMKKQSDCVFGQIDGLKNAASEIMNLCENTQNEMNVISQQAKNSSNAAEKNLEISDKVFGLVKRYKV